MTREKLPKILFWSCVFCILISSGSILLMPVASRIELEGERWLLVLSGLLFWVPMIAGYALLFFANSLRKRSGGGNRPPGGFKAWGMLNLCSNIWALIADAVFVLGLIGLVVFALVSRGSYGVYACLFVAALALHLHGILNGANFEFATGVKRNKIRLFRGENRKFVFGINIKNFLTANRRGN